MGTYAFAFQIYCDFSGYSDIARGIARVLGFDLCLNFNLPYLARNPREFWRRWHISLSQWFRDYVYIPLGGSRQGYLRTLSNMMVTMALCGLWHGASWHFVAWGAYHGALLIGYDLVRGRHVKIKDKAVSWSLVSIGSMVLTFHLICIGWIVFRVESIEHFMILISGTVSNSFFQGVNGNLVVTFLILVIPLIVLQFYQASRQLEVWLSWSAPARTAFFTILIYQVFVVQPTEQTAFIYFQF